MSQSLQCDPISIALLGELLAWFWSRITRILPNDLVWPGTPPDDRCDPALDIKVEAQAAPATVLENVLVQFTTDVIKVFP